MAADWIKWEKGTALKPEISMMASALGIDDRIIPTLCLIAWEWADANTENGNAPGVTFLLLDRVTGVAGFGKAMMDAGWLLDDGDGIQFPKFDRHNTQTAKRRALTNARVAKNRAKCNGRVTPM